MAAQEQPSNGGNAGGAGAGGGDAPQENKRSSLLDKVYGEQEIKGELGVPGAGALFKLGGKFVKFTWQQRYVTMINFNDNEEQPRLSWALEKGTVERGFLELGEATLVTPATVVTGAKNPNLTFTLTQKEDGSKQYHFEAPTAELLNGWMETLRNRIMQTLPSGPVPAYINTQLKVLQDTFGGDTPFTMANTNWFQIAQTSTRSKNPRHNELWNWRLWRRFISELFLHMLYKNIKIQCDHNPFLKEALNAVMPSRVIKFEVVTSAKLEERVAGQSKRGGTNWRMTFSPGETHIELSEDYGRHDEQDAKRLSEHAVDGLREMLRRYDIQTGRWPYFMQRQYIEIRKQEVIDKIQELNEVLGGTFTWEVDYKQFFDALDPSYSHEEDDKLPDHLYSQVLFPLVGEIKYACKEIKGAKDALIALTGNKKIIFAVANPRLDDRRNTKYQANYINGNIEVYLKTGQKYDSMSSFKNNNNGTVEILEDIYQGQILVNTPINIYAAANIAKMESYRLSGLTDLEGKWKVSDLTLEVNFAAILSSVPPDQLRQHEKSVGDYFYRDVCKACSEFDRTAHHLGTSEYNEKIRREFLTMWPTKRIIGTMAPLEVDERNSNGVQLNIKDGQLEVRVANFDVFKNLETLVKLGAKKDLALMRKNAGLEPVKS